MKAVILEEINGPLAIRDIETTDLKLGQVLVRMKLSGLCGAQLHEIAGLKNNARFLPHLLGHEGFGVVEEVGPGVTKVRSGDTVVLHWRAGSGLEGVHPQYKMMDKIISSGKVTTLSEKTVASENRLTVVPSDTDEVVGTLLGCSLSTGLSTIDNELSLKIGESILIIGAGGVGLNLVLGSMIRGAGKIGVVEPHVDKWDLCALLGATELYQKADEVVSEFDYVVDTTANPRVVELFLRLVKGGGTIVMIGQPMPGSALILNEALKLFDGSGTTLKATQGGGFQPDRDIPRYLQSLSRYQVEIRKVVSHYFELDQINQAVEVLRSGTAGRIMLRCQSE